MFLAAFRPADDLTEAGVAFSIARQQDQPSGWFFCCAEIELHPGYRVESTGPGKLVKKELAAEIVPVGEGQRVEAYRHATLDELLDQGLAAAATGAGAAHAADIVGVLCARPGTVSDDSAMHALAVTHQHRERKC